MSYRPLRPGRHATVPIRGLDHHLIRWGPDSDDPILLLHGYADCAATFQFVADEIDPGLPLAAVDWRGFGESARSPGGYWFPDYYADLEALIDALCPRGPARIVGHSMGANVAMIYAGARCARVRALVNLEGFGLPRTQPSQAPTRLRPVARRAAHAARAGRLPEHRRARGARREAQPADLARRTRSSSPRAGARQGPRAA
jgi:pimeloyl-ACP methyl ester carboxylesterase